MQSVQSAGDRVRAAGLRPVDRNGRLETMLGGAPVPYILFGLALCARLMVWPRSDVVDADAVTRSLIGESYMHYPGWAGDGSWPPLHFYLNGLFYLLSGSREVGSVLVNIVLGSAIVFPLFAFARRWSSMAVATTVAVLVVFDPLVFRNSLQGLSEVPFFFLAVCAFNAIDRGISDTSNRGGRHMMLGGLFLTVASGIRYEAWSLIVLCSFIILASAPRRLFHFLLPAIVFPVVWIITDHLAHGTMLEGVKQAFRWKSDPSALEIPEGQLLLRMVFFPTSLLLALSPFAVLLCLLGTGRTVLKGGVKRSQWIWLLLFPAFLAIMITKARYAELLLQHRFTMTLILLFIPFLVLGFASIRSQALVLFVAFAIAFGNLIMTSNGRYAIWLGMDTKESPTKEALTFIRDNTLRDLEPVPALNSTLPDRLVEKINADSQDRRLLVLEFFGWQETYNVAFRAHIRASSIVFLPGDDQMPQGLAKLDDYLSHISGFDGILLLVKGSAYHRALRPLPGGAFALKLPTRQLGLTPLSEVDHVAMYLFATGEPAPPE